MSISVEVKLAKEIVLPVLPLLREQAATLRVGADLNGAPTTDKALSDTSRFLGLFRKDFEETATICVDSESAAQIARACAVLRFQLRVGVLSAISDETLQQDLNPELAHGVDPKAVTAYLFLGTVLELVLQHFGALIANPTLPSARRWWRRVQTMFGKRRNPGSHDDPHIPRSDTQETGCVIVRDDPVNSMTYVTIVFRSVLALTEEDARRHMKEIHEHKRSTVWEGARQEAEARMHELRSWHLNAEIRERLPAIKPRLSG